MRDRKRPYEVWQAGDWTWNVLKKYQSPEKESLNPYARWMCFVTSPYAPHGDMGNVYIREIANQGAVLVAHDYD
jgi:hypothetical protein